jgi:hypothetical protein
MPNTYDPRWITPKFGRCSGCGADLTHQNEPKAFYFPRTKTILCVKCGEPEALRFESELQDEDINQQMHVR